MWCSIKGLRKRGRGRQMVVDRKKGRKEDRREKSIHSIYDLNN